MEDRNRHQPSARDAKNVARVTCPKNPTLACESHSTCGLIASVYKVVTAGTGSPDHTKRYVRPLRTLPTSAGRKQAMHIPPS